MTSFNLQCWEQPEYGLFDGAPSRRRHASATRRPRDSGAGFHLRGRPANDRLRSFLSCEVVDDS